MKRTFTVTVEEEEGTVHAEDIRRQLSRGEYRATVTETTAVHAKERRLIEECLRMARLESMGQGQDAYDAGSRACTLARELRALMEGKA